MARRQGPSLYLAAEKGDLEEVKRLLAHQGVDIHERGEREDTPLHIACYRGHINVVSLLLDKGADLNRTNKWGDTPLLRACYRGHIDVVSLLLDKGADLNSTNKFEFTPLHVACHGGHLNMVHMLLKLNVAVNTKTKKLVDALYGGYGLDYGLDAAYDAAGYGLDVGYGGGAAGYAAAVVLAYGGYTPLHMACAMGNLSCVQQLLSAPGIDVNVKNGRGETAVMIAKNYHVLVLLKKYLKICDDFPIHTVGKVVLCGNTGAGKSTLTKVVVDWKLSVCEENAMMISSHPQDVKPLTAGILSYYVPHSDGSIKLYDLAGHLEYYSSHSSCLEAISQSSPSTFLLLTDISKEHIDDIKTELNYWTAMIGNVCCKCPQPSEVIVVGTHSDKLEKAKLNVCCGLLNQSADDALKKTKHHFAGFITLNVTNRQSAAMKSFMDLLFKTIEVVRKRCPAISLNCHVLYAFLMQMVPSGTDAITLSHLLSLLAGEKEHGLGTDISEITLYLTTLSDKGLIVFFPNADHTDSWIVFNQDALLKTVNGTLFAPASFKEYRHSLVSNTGIIPISNLKRLFPNHNVDMISQFLLHSELCQPVVDIIDAAKTLSDCIFCPSLVHDSRPSDVIIPQSSFVYLMHTGDGSEFFTTRCLYAVIHRIAKQCTLPSDEFKHDKELHCFSRRCTVWSTGIAWINELGITFVVEMDKSLQCITLAASTDKNKDNPQYPSAYKHVLEVIKKCCKDFCPSVAINMKEHIRCPSLPCLGPTTADVVLSELKNAFLSKSRTLAGVRVGKEIDLNEWLQVEPQLPLLIGVNVKKGMPPSSEPTLKELMDEVAAKTPAKWRLIGIQLGVPEAALDSIQTQVAGQPDSCIHAFQLMLGKWKSLYPHQYTWATIIDALEAPSVGAVDVAAELRTK